MTKNYKASSIGDIQARGRVTLNGKLALIATYFGIDKAPDFTKELTHARITPIGLFEHFLQTTIVSRFVRRVDLRQCSDCEPCVRGRTSFFKCKLEIFP